MPTLTLERSILIAAPRQRVWEAITAPEQLAQWLMPPALGAQLKTNDSGQLSVLMGPMEVGVALIENSDPPRQVTTRGRSIRIALHATANSSATPRMTTALSLRRALESALPAVGRC